MSEDHGDKPTMHRWLGYAVTKDSGHIAICSCGWQTLRLSSAGLAGAAIDRHIEEGRAAEF